MATSDAVIELKELTTQLAKAAKRLGATRYLSRVIDRKEILKA